MKKNAAVVQLSPLRHYADAPRTYGNLKDADRIFTNLYGQGDWGIKGAMKRVCSQLRYMYFSLQTRVTGIERKILF